MKGTIETRSFSTNSNYSRKRGILCVVFSALSFSIMNTFARLAGDIPVMEKTFFRNFVAVIVISLILFKNKQRIVLKKERIPFLLMRSAFGTLGVMANFYAMDHMLMSDATIIVNLSPFFAIVFSTIILRERATWKQYALILIALFGSILVIKPTMGVFGNYVTFAALGCAVFSGIAYTMIRVLSQMGEESTTIVFFFSAFSCVTCLPAVLLNPVIPNLTQFVCLFTAAIFACLGQFFVTAAYRYAPASEISVFSYTQIAFAAIWDFVGFGQVSDLVSYVGYAVILGAAVMVSRRDNI